uniref:NADH-ubiquinone oxidoreductase chain 4L n=1 Tax=Oryzaephilus surinamensis TaxID=41112 RepID=A0A1P8YZK7_ORYSU|nr:NADH dehydrogenase subunit 4L [Oryzaephilus surinamensis]QCP68868.1 NADH dehydrogenase subunit 4L [Oryzaephilus surinamensis]UNH68025.1 NADH dehydrogenase subunit 4L [Oryzaephilus surinamensis]
MFIYWWFFFCGLVSFSLNRNHLLLVLLSLEFIILSLYYFIFNFLIVYSGELYLSMVYIVVSVCEGVLGLSVLVSMVRCYGNDNFLSFTLLW